MNKLIVSAMIFTITASLNASDYPLGRNKDPKTVDDINPISLFFKKALWETLSLPGMRFMANLNFPESTIIFFNVENAVAFTIDDGFCGADNPNGDMTKEIRELFKKYDAKATFFTSGSHCKHTEPNEIKLLLEDGHEIANHSMFDTPYNKFTKDDFLKDFEMTDEILSSYTSNIPKWYRAPHAKVSKDMMEVIDLKRYKHVMCDGFANDTSIPDPEWISSFILRKTKPGSIILIHMPEKGVREWNYEAIELTLKGLKEKNLKILNLTEISKLSKQNNFISN